MPRGACAFLFLLLSLVPVGCRQDSPVPPDQSVAGQLKKKVLTARDNPSQLFGETEYRYGPDRSLLKTESYYFPENQRVIGEYTEYSYDNAGRQAGSDNYVRHASGDFRLFAQTVFEYANGLLVRETITYPAQVVTVITYEYAEGRLVKKSFLDGNNALHYYLAFEYDGAGKLTGETNFLPSGTPTQFVRYTYRNGLRQEKNTFSGDPARPERELWSTIRYGYDGQNRLAFEKTEYISPLSSSIFPTVRYEYY